MEKQKICIIGGGLSGLVTAISLSKTNCDIDFITGSNKRKNTSNRTVAISQDNFEFLKKLNIFKSIKKDLWPCQEMKIYNEKNNKSLLETFQLSDKKNHKNLLYMLENSKFEKLMIDEIKKNKSITLKKNISVKKVFDAGILKGIKINNKIKKYNLIVICTGNNSALIKNLFHEECIENSYGEKSITTILNHSSLNNNIARQIFLNNEIFALLPISNTKTSIVWSVKKNIYEKSNTLIKNKIMIYASNFIKKIKFATPLEYRDLNFLIRNQYYKNRILLFGDALHSVHPLAGQGFNMILRDLTFLEKILKDKIRLGLDVGSISTLSEFTKKTKVKNFVYSFGIDLIKKNFSLEKKYLKELRSNILKVANKNVLLKEVLFNIANKGIRL